MSQYRSHLTSTNRKPPQEKWSPAIRVFHWGGVLLFFAVWLMITLHENMADAGATYIVLHKALGIVVLVWTVLHAFIYFSSKKPSYANLHMTKWQIVLAQLVHLLLLAIFIMMPLSGLLMSVYGGRPVNMFGLFTIPVFVVPDGNAAGFFNGLHEWIWRGIMALLGLHVFAVIYHKLVLKDSIIRRML